MISVTDSLSNANDQIARAASLLRNTKDKMAVFLAVCYGKKQYKTVEDIMDATDMTRKRVREDAAKLAKQKLITKVRKDGEVVYQRNDFLAENRGRILSLARDRKKLDRFPTKTNPRGNASKTVTIKFPRQRVRATSITVDDVDSFGKVAKVAVTQSKLVGLSEKAFKEGIKAILGDKGAFKDWGGERNDLLSTRVVFRGRRRSVAFAFKGPGTGGKLTPAKLGKNGDQIQRLFQSPADLYFVQYWSQIDESVLEQMETFAKVKSVADDREVFFGVIDGSDSSRLVAAYPKQFGQRGRTKGEARGN